MKTLFEDMAQRREELLLRCRGRIAKEEERISNVRVILVGETGAGEQLIVFVQNMMKE